MHPTKSHSSWYNYSYHILNRRCNLRPHHNHLPCPGRAVHRCYRSLNYNLYYGRFFDRSSDFHHRVGGQCSYHYWHSVHPQHCLKKLDVSQKVGVNWPHYLFLRILSVTISRLYQCTCLNKIHGDEWDVDKCFIWLRDEVYTACQFRMGIRVGVWGQDSTCIWIVSSTSCV